ncbi:MAG TPA: hypothetical protein DCE44_11290 [Verrucomicrobiales bacterium]|nr:hypothetical protein [Verrucomicrobiales bacterium]
MSLTVTPKSGTFRFSGNGDAEWQRPFGARGRPQLTGTLAVERAAPALTTQPPNRAPVTAALNFQCKGMIAIADGLRFNGGNLAFTKALSGWSLNGGFQGIFFNESAEFKAGMEIAGDARTFEFATKLSGDALAIPDIVALTAANVVLKARSATTPAVVATRAPATTPTTAPATSTSARTWDLSLVAAATLKLGGQPGFSGNLVLAHGATADSIALELTPGSRVSAKLPFPNHEVTVNVEAGRFSFASQAPSAGSQTRTWVLEAAGALRIEGLPQRLAEILPRSISGSIRADPAGVIISANRVVQDQSIQLPALEVGKTKAELGQVGIDIPSLRVGIGREVTLTADLGLGLPCELNHIFGSKSDGTPAVEFFNTYQPGKADSFFRLAVEIGTAGLSLRPLTSPIRAIKSVVENGEAWWNCDFGNFGAAKVRVPVLTYDAATTAFRASGGFVITRPLKVPLAPFKKILEAGGLGAASQAFPDGVPLKDITLVNSEGHLRTDELTQMLQEVSEGQIPNEVTDAIETIGDRLDQLPDRFKKYLSIQVPDGFNFDLSAAPEGNVRLDARVKDPNQPIRLLLPSLALAPVPVPALNGIELRSVSFGELLGGSLFQIHVDADFDQFDLINLAASLLLPDSDSSLLPRPHDLQRHLCLDRLFMIVVYQTGIPIPVPIFYDNVGLEALEFAGHGFGLRWQFPQPKPGAGDLMGFFRDIKPFFTDSDYLLPTATDDDVFARHNLGLKFSVNPGYIQLPKYLGGKLLGQKGELFSVSLTKGLAEMLNALKKPSLARLLGVVPLSYRVGEEEITFGPMSVQVAWAMTTSEEFRGLDSASGQPGKFLQRLNELPAGQREEMLTLANLGTASDEGAFVLLLGDWSLASQVSFSVRLALAQAANGRAGFGFGLNGRLGDVLEFEAGGCAIFGHAESPNLSAIRECQALVDRLDPEVARLKQEIADRNDRLGSDQKNLTKLNADLRQFQMRLPGLQRFRGWRMNADLGDADAPPEKIGSVPAGGRRVNPRLADVDDPRFKGPGGPGGYGNYWGQAGGLKTAPGGQTTPRDVPAGGDPPVRVGPPAPGAQAFQKMITESETKIADLKNQIPQLESAIAESRATIASASANLSEAEPQLTRARSELANLIPQQATWKDTGIQINGHCRLTLLGDEVLTGKLALTDREFAVEGALDLFPRSPLLRITGQLAGRISDQEFALAGAASMVLGGTFTLASATAEITQIGARVRGTWLNQTVTFSIQKCNGGAQLSAAMSKISVGDILSITDASGASGPTAILTTADSPRLTLSGGASLLGLSTTTDVVFTEGNVRFAGTGNLFGVFQAALAVSGSDLMNGGALQVTATFESDLFRYLIEQGTDALQKAIEGASKGVDSAKAEVDAKQKDVDSLDQQIKDMRATIEGERRAATSNLSDAQATVDKWQREVNSLNGQIESTKRDYYNLPKSDWVWNKSQITEAIPFAATISSLEAAKYSATAFLEASNQVLEGIKKGAQLTPVEMDPRMFGLMGAQETATFALNRAKEILEAAQKAIGAVGDVANYIDNHGIANLLNVTAARFSASLTEAATGVVSLSADVIYMGRPGTVDFAFNFMNPIEGAKSLANRLLHP